MRRATRARRPAALAALTGALLASLLGLAAPADARVVPTPVAPTVDEESPVEVEVRTLAPRAPTSPDEPLQLTGRLVNQGSEPVRDLRLRLLVDGVLRSRSALALADAEPGSGRVRGPEVEPARDELAPGASTAFDVRLPVGELGMTRLGVYPVALQVRGRVGDDRRPAPVGQASTFLPWFPEGPPAPTRIAFLWPLVDVPARTPSDIVLERDLHVSLEAPDGDGPGGRLGRLLAAARAGTPGECDPPAGPLPDASGEPAAAPPAPPAPTPADPAVPPSPTAVQACRGEPVPLTYAVDPALLEAAVVLSSPHRIRTEGGELEQRPASPAAQAWLSDLQSALSGLPPEGSAPALPAADLLALPYADPDVVAMTRSSDGLTSEVEQLRALGTGVAADLLSAEPLEEIAWPPPGPLSSAALDATVAGGARAVVLDEEALPPRRFDLARTPGTRTDLSATTSDRVTALVVDAGLSALIAATEDDPGWQGERLAEQRWLVETAMLAAERPGESRTVLVAPPRRTDVDPEVAGPALRDAGRLPWLCPVAVVDVVTGRDRCSDEPAGPPSEPEERGDLQSGDGEGELSQRHLREVAEVRVLGEQLTDDVLVPGSDAAAETKARLLRARGRAVSSAWRDDPAGGQRMLRLLRAEVERLRGKVRLSTSGQALLTSTSGVIDVVITNELDQPVTLGVALNDPVEARLTSTDTDLRTIGPSQAVPVRVQVEARTSGQFVVRATLLDREGRPFGEPVELVARSTGYGRLALAVTGVAAGVLLVAIGVRIVRRALHAGRPEEESS